VGGKQGQTIEEQANTPNKGDMGEYTPIYHVYLVYLVKTGKGLSSSHSFRIMVQEG